MDVRITMSSDPSWMVRADGTPSGEQAKAVWKSINDGAAIEAYSFGGGGTSPTPNWVVLNPAHVLSVHEVPDRQ